MLLSLPPPTEYEDSDNPTPSITFYFLNLSFKINVIRDPKGVGREPCTSGGVIRKVGDFDYVKENVCNLKTGKGDS